MGGIFPNSYLLIGVSVIALGTTPAIAQDNQTGRNVFNDREIIVSANKREQTLQDTPIAITAVTAQQVELRGLSETKDLSAIAPNVVVSGGTTNATAAVVTIRGIPTPGDETQGFDSPIGLYLDGVYLARQSAASFEVADIERVEVLRGPQGTLFGRNTTGGAINYITSRPSEEFSVRAKIGYGNYDRKLARLIVNSGDIGGVRLSGGYIYKARDGIVDNLLEPRKSRDPGGFETNGVRFAMEADLGNFMLTNIFDWTQTKGVPPANQLAAVGDGTFRPDVTINGYQFAQVQPANVRGYLGLASVLEPVCPSPLNSISLKRLDKLCNEADGVSTDKIYGNMTRLEWQGDTVLVRSTTAFRWWKNRIEGTDLDGMGTLRGPLFTQASVLNGMPANLIAFTLAPEQQAFAPFISATPVPYITYPLFQAFNQRRQRQFSQEIEIVGGTGTAIEWVVGGFYFRERGYERNPQDFGFVLDTNQTVFNATNFAALAPLFAAANPARFRLVPQESILEYRAWGKSYAIYGQGTYRPGGADAPVGITLGLRYTWDKKRFARYQNGAVPFTSPIDLELNRRSAKFSQPTGHITVDYQPDSRFNLYAKAARGYRSGGFNARQSTQQDNPATPNVNEEVALIPFGAEKIDAFEIGAKMDLGRARLNLAAFHNIYKDQQVTVPIPIVGGGSFGTQVINAGKTKFTGFEAEATVDVSDNLLLDASFGYVDIAIKQFPSADINGDLRNIASVLTPGVAPDTTASAGITFTNEIGSGDARLTARLGWTYTSKQAFFPNPLTAPFQKETSGNARSLFNAQLRVDNISFGNGPGFSVLLWGKNITNEKYVSRSVDFGQLGFATVIYGDPATFGIDIEFSF